jgi:outer membrane protein
MRRPLGWVLAAATLAWSPVAAADPQTLEEVLAIAYSSNPTLKARQANVRAVDETVAQARSNFRPEIGASGSVTRNEIDDESTIATAGVNLTQPIFRGGRTVNAVRSAEAGVKAAREGLRSTEANVLFSAVQAYMNVVRDEAVLKLNESQVAVLGEQLKAARDRFRVGELTRTDVAQSEARLSVATTGKIAAEGGLTTSREFFRQIVGQAPEQLVNPGLPKLPGSVDEAIQTGFAESAEIQAARFQEEAARADVALAKSNLAPFLDANAGVSWSDISGPAPRGAQNTVGRIGATLTVPLYQAGFEHSRVRQALAARSQRQMELTQALRNVEEDVRNAWAGLRTAQSQVQSTQAAVRANEIALEGVRQEAAVGSRTTLDVLNAEQELLDSRVTLVQAQRDEVVAAYGVLASIGRMEARVLGLTGEVYDPTVNYRAVRDRWFGWDTPEER